MRYGIPLLGDRVAPRSSCAEALLVVVERRRQARRQSTTPLPGRTLADLAKLLAENRVDVLICGGVSRQEREFLTEQSVDIIDNVVATVDDLLGAIQAGTLRPGFGLENSKSGHATTKVKPTKAEKPGVADSDPRPAAVDCLACRERICLTGQSCAAAETSLPAAPDERGNQRIREAALDISFESERTLCRLSELIYFCLEMRYERIGLAYCVDLEEPADIVARVLRRFFQVYPVCCKVNGSLMTDGTTGPVSARSSNGRQVACNPAGQAAVLNRLNTDFNVVVGLCIGSDCLFSRLSEVPTTTLFVKDKSLANNPIGAVYSDYYLKEAIGATRSRSYKESET